MAWFDRVEFIPGERGGHETGVAHAVGGGDRLIPCVLVVVDEHATALFLPPCGGGQVFGAALYFSGQCQAGAADLEVVPLGLQSYVDVDSPVPTRLGPSDQAVFGKKCSTLCRHPPAMVESEFLRWVEVETQLVWMVEVIDPGVPGVEVEYPQLHLLDDVGHVCYVRHLSGSG